VFHRFEHAVEVFAFGAQRVDFSHGGCPSKGKCARQGREFEMC
jgi:hypothetical protein